MEVTLTMMTPLLLMQEQEIASLRRIRERVNALLKMAQGDDDAPHNTPAEDRRSRRAG
jgi:hypothetical protein